MSLARRLKTIKKAEPQKVTPIIERFLLENPEGVIWDDAGFSLFREIVERSQGNDAAGRAGRFGASSRGTCMRRQMFSFLGMPAGRLLDPSVQNLFNDGKWRHLRWQMMLVQSGAATHAEWPATFPKYRMKCSMDALNAEEQWLFELKGDRYIARILGDGVPEAHMLQMHSMMLVTGWDDFVYVMEDKSTSEWREFRVKKDPDIMRRVRNEMEDLNEHVERRVLPDVLPACASKEGPYRTCPYAAQCIERHRAVGNQWPDEPGNWES